MEKDGQDSFSIQNQVRKKMNETKDGCGVAIVLNNQFQMTDFEKREKKMTV